MLPRCSPCSLCAPSVLPHAPSLLPRAPSLLSHAPAQPLPAPLSLTLTILPCNFKRWTAIQPAFDLRGASCGFTTHYVIVCSFLPIFLLISTCLPQLFGVRNAHFFFLPHYLLSSPYLPILPSLYRYHWPVPLHLPAILASYLPLWRRRRGPLRSSLMMQKQMV